MQGRIDGSVNFQSALGFEIFSEFLFEIVLYEKYEVRVLDVFAVFSELEVYSSNDDLLIFFSRNLIVFQKPSGDEILASGIVFEVDHRFAAGS